MAGGAPRTRDAVTAGQEDRGANNEVRGTRPSQLWSRACEELDGQMGPTVAESENGLAFSGGPDLKKAKAGDVRREG
jgi:hypothetical protein